MRNLHLPEIKTSVAKVYAEDGTMLVEVTKVHGTKSKSVPPCRRVIHRGEGEDLSKFCKRGCFFKKR